MCKCVSELIKRGDAKRTTTSLLLSLTHAWRPRRLFVDCRQRTNVFIKVRAWQPPELRAQNCVAAIAQKFNSLRIERERCPPLAAAAALIASQSPDSQSLLDLLDWNYLVHSGLGQKPDVILICSFHIRPDKNVPSPNFVRINLYLSPAFSWNNIREYNNKGSDVNHDAEKIGCQEVLNRRQIIWD